MTVKDIVKEYLEKNGFDGLYNPGECACKLDSLMPCDERFASVCEPGYLCSGDDEWLEECDFYIGPVREERRCI